MRKDILVCVAWPYANSSLHLGQIAGACLPADIFARYHRLRGNRVLMVSGSDEHGTPITVTADKEDKPPQEIVERYHREHAESLRKIGISFDCYSRTTDPAHQVMAQDFFKTLLKNGFIEERPSQALYCPHCRRFLPDRYVEGGCPFCAAPDARGDQCDRCGKTLDPRDLKLPRCRLCGMTPDERETKLHYLLLSNLERKLGAYLESRTGWKSNVMNFTRNWIKEGLHDRAITRDLAWGVPVPLEGCVGKCLYVWFEAVIGYYSASRKWADESGNPQVWRDFWENPNSESYYFIGKDNIPFHTIIWPAMLIGHGGLNLPTNVPANEYLLLSGEKFSKSRGVGVRLAECLDEFGPDQVRYYLSSIMPETSDANFSWDDFMQKNNEEFLSVIGNFINRVAAFAKRTFGGRIPEPFALLPQDKEAIEAARRCGHAMAQAFERFEFKKSLKEALALAQIGNQYVDKQAPWKLAKQDVGRCQTVTYTGLSLGHALAVYLHPFLPFTTNKIWSQFGLGSEIPAGYWREDLAPMMPGGVFGDVAPLVKKIEREVEYAEKSGS